MSGSILKATALTVALTAGCLAAGYALASPLISGVGSLLGFDELIVTGPNDLLVARLKVAFALATVPAGAWLATLVAQLRRRGEPWAAAFGLRFAFVLAAVAAGMAGKVMYLRWAVDSMRDSQGGFVAPAVMLGDVAPGSWGLAAGLLAAIVLAAVAAVGAPRRRETRELKSVPLGRRGT